MPNAHVTIDPQLLRSVLAEQGMKQSDLARHLGVDDSSLSRWLQKGKIDFRISRSLKSALSLDETAYRELLRLPAYRVFFRKHRNGEIDAKRSVRATECARAVLFASKELREVSFANLSSESCAETIAQTIIADLQVTSRTLEGWLIALQKKGVHTVLAPFSLLELTDDDALEQAFSVIYGREYVIFASTDHPLETVVHNLVHEVVHLYRPDLDRSSEEEKFVNEVATVLQLPVKPKELKTQWEKLSDSNRGPLYTTRTLAIDYGVSPSVVAHRAKHVGIKVPGWVFGKLVEEMSALTTITSQHFRDDWATRTEFWAETAQNPIYFGFFARIKNLVEAGEIDFEKFADLFRIEAFKARELISVLRAASSQNLGATETTGEL
jgi:hypothetical protein